LQLLLDLFSLSAASMVALKRHPVFGDNASAATVEKFILEQLNLIKDVVSEIKVPGLLFSSVLLHHRIACDLGSGCLLEIPVAHNLINNFYMQKLYLR